MLASHLFFVAYESSSNFVLSFYIYDLNVCFICICVCEVCLVGDNLLFGGGGWWWCCCALWFVTLKMSVSFDLILSPYLNNKSKPYIWSLVCCFISQHSTVPNGRYCISLKQHLCAGSDFFFLSCSHLLPHKRDTMQKFAHTFWTIRVQKEPIAQAKKSRKNIIKHNDQKV